MAYEKQIWTTGETITADKLNHIEDGIANSGSGSDSSSSILLESTTYAELLTKRNGGTLTPGMQYRITDYVCTTTQEESRAVSHPFDIIVTADDESTLNENARACLHEGDDYYSAEGHWAKLEAWELKYCIDNDAGRFAWADTENGKGVIFWLKDERGNECPYDFKQIQFKRYPITECSITSLVGKYTTLNHGSVITEINEESPIWCYTFSFIGSGYTENQLLDASIIQTNWNQSNGGCYVYNNIINTYYNYIQVSQKKSKTIYYLNNIIIFSTFSKDCSNNIFGTDCYNNTLENQCYNNTFGKGCYNNTFGKGCYNNTFGNDCYLNTFGKDCYYNTFEKGCYSNTFGDDCKYNYFKNFCSSNNFGKGCYTNTLEDLCKTNSFKNNCYNNKLNNASNNIFNEYCINIQLKGYSCEYNTFGYFCSDIIFNNCSYIDFSGGSTNNSIAHYRVTNVSGYSSSHITLVGTSGNNYVTYIGKNTNNELKTWVPADLAP